MVGGVQVGRKNVKFMGVSSSNRQARNLADSLIKENMFVELLRALVFGIGKDFCEHLATQPILTRATAINKHWECLQVLIDYGADFPVRQGMYPPVWISCNYFDMNTFVQFMRVDHCGLLNQRGAQMIVSRLLNIERNRTPIKCLVMVSSLMNSIHNSTMREEIYSDLWGWYNDEGCNKENNFYLPRSCAKHGIHHSLMIMAEFGMELEAYRCGIRSISMACDRGAFDYLVYLARYGIDIGHQPSFCSAFWHPWSKVWLLFPLIWMYLPISLPVSIWFGVKESRDPQRVATNNGHEMCAKLVGEWRKESSSGGLNSDTEKNRFLDRFLEANGLSQYCSV